MGRLTADNMTPAERAAFTRLQQAVGFAPKVYFGRDNGNDALLDRIREEGVTTIYAIAVNGGGQKGKKGVREFRLLLAPVPVTLANGTRDAARPKPRPHPKGARTWNKAERARISDGVKAAWAKRRTHAATTG